MPAGQDQNQTNPPSDTASSTPPLGANAPDVNTDANPATSSDGSEPTSDNPSENGDSIITEIASRIFEAHNILIALSSDPSVDEMAAAIGLSICLDRAGKRATAIYSGATPNALEFLKPEDTFETSSDTLQDFVIALNKEKADHLRYKLDGDFVKIFITPYKTRIAEEDLEFSYGDFNIDLVISLNVPNGVDLDAALREHGRIMHDATIINITTGNPGKFGEIEWSDKAASSVSEMTARLLYSMSRKIPIEADDATAFLTGVVAATNRFSNNKTTPECMKVASRLLESGANQQLISENITSDIESELLSPSTTSIRNASSSNDDSLEISHIGEKSDNDEATTDETPETMEPATELTTEPTIEPSTEPTAESTIEPTPESPESPTTQPSEDMIPVPEGIVAEAEATQIEPMDEPPVEKIVAPSTEFVEDVATSANRYGQMLEEALAESNPVAPEAAPVEPESAPLATPTITPDANPAAGLAPAVATAPEINGVPEMNYAPMPGEEVLPPPPAPPIDLNSDNPLPPMPTENPGMPPLAPTPSQPSMPQPTASQEPDYTAPAVVQPGSMSNPEPVSNPAPAAPLTTPTPEEPSAFKIPGAN